MVFPPNCTPYYEVPTAYWDKFFQGQAGGANFVGLKFQRGGFALGSLFRGLAKSVLPVLKTAGKSIGKQAIRTGLDVASDVLEGRDAGEAVKARSRKAASSLIRKSQTAMLKKKKKTKKVYKGGKRLGFMGNRIAKSSIVKRDIFGQ